MADAVVFSKLFIAIPDLVKRLQQDLPLNMPDKSTFYGSGEKGLLIIFLPGKLTSSQLLQNGQELAIIQIPLNTAN